MTCCIAGAKHHQNEFHCHSVTVLVKVSLQSYFSTVSCFKYIMIYLLFFFFYGTLLYSYFVTQFCLFAFPSLRSYTVEIMYVQPQ